MKLPALGAVLLGTGLEAIKVSEKTCRTIGDCGFLQARCDTHFGCFAYALGQSDENLATVLVLPGLSNSKHLPRSTE